MISKVTYDLYVQQHTLKEEDVYDHIIKTFHPDLTVKQALLVKHNLTLILQATFKLSRVMSFSKMTVRDLQKETGISMGGLYNCFASKEELERMVIEGVLFINEFTNKRAQELKIPEEYIMPLTIKAYVYLGRLFKPWFYFVAMESRTMSQANLRLVVEVRSDYLTALTRLLKGSRINASHMSTIIQDYNIRDWKFKDVDIDQFADHCVQLARLLSANAASFSDLSINLSGE